MFSLLKPLLHAIDPELVHELTVNSGGQGLKIPGVEYLLSTLFRFENVSLNIRVGNLTFSNPVGLAAGFDKNGMAIPLLQALGFGFVEVGTVTPRAQVGNPKKRLFRLKKDQAIINRMGFNNHGVDALVSQIKGIKKKSPVGVNIGKNKDTPLDQALNDYLICLEKAWHVADYFTVNISSPNTANLRDLQSEEHLYPLIQGIINRRDQLADETGLFRQVWLKIAPDLDDEQIKVIAQIAIELKIDALIVSNTTISRPDLLDEQRDEQGGLSGKPLLKPSTVVLSKMYKHTKDVIPLVGVGGIFTAEDAYDKVLHGASLIQIYTGMIYNGPGMVKEIKSGLVRIMQQQQVGHLPERIGCATMQIS